MKLTAPYQCDAKGCANMKQPSNGWFLILEEATLENVPLPELVTGAVTHIPQFSVIPWDAPTADLEGVRHGCSAECTTKLLNEWMMKIQGRT